MNDETKQKINERYARELNRGERFWPDSIFKDLPRSTEQVLHPEKYLAREEPRVVQMPGLQERHDTRNRNAKYITENLKDIPGLIPQKLYEGTTEGSWYIYAWAYKKEQWNNAPREKFLKALAAEGISLSPYIANGLHREPWRKFIKTLPE